MYNLVARGFPQSLAKKPWQPVCELKCRAVKKKIKKFNSKGIYKSRLQWCLDFFSASISFFFYLAMALVYLTDMHMNHIIYLCESLAFKETQITHTLAIKKIGYFLFHL